METIINIILEYIIILQSKNWYMLHIGIGHSEIQK